MTEWIPDTFASTVTWLFVQVAVVSSLGLLLRRLIGVKGRAAVGEATLATIGLLTIAAFLPIPSWTFVPQIEVIQQTPQPITVTADDAFPFNLPPTSEELLPPAMRQAAAISTSTPTPQAVRTSSPPFHVNWPLTLSVVVVLGAIVGLLRLTMAVISLTRLVRRSRRLTDEEIAVVTRGLTKRHSRFRECAEIKTPAVAGLLRPTVLLPPAWRSWSDGERRAAIAHELAHVSRRDPLRQAAAELVRAAHFANPLPHLLLRRYAFDRETAADAVAAESLGDRDGYAASLAGMALRADSTLTSGPTLWPAHALDSHSVPRRLTMFKRPKVRNLTRREGVALAGMFAILAVTAAGFRPTGEAEASKIADEDRLTPLTSSTMPSLVPSPPPEPVASQSLPLELAPTRQSQWQPPLASARTRPAPDEPSPLTDGPIYDDIIAFQDEPLDGFADRPASSEDDLPGESAKSAKATFDSFAAENQKRLNPTAFAVAANDDKAAKQFPPKLDTSAVRDDAWSEAIKYVSQTRDFKKGRTRLTLVRVLLEGEPIPKTFSPDGRAKPEEEQGGEEIGGVPVFLGDGNEAEATTDDADAATEIDETAELLMTAAGRKLRTLGHSPALGSDPFGAGEYGGMGGGYGGGGYDGGFGAGNGEEGYGSGDFGGEGYGGEGLEGGYGGEGAGFAEMSSFGTPSAQLSSGGRYAQLRHGQFFLVEHDANHSGGEPVYVGSFTHAPARLTLKHPPEGRLGIAGDLVLAKVPDAQMGQIAIPFASESLDGPGGPEDYTVTIGTAAVGGIYGHGIDAVSDESVVTTLLPPGTYKLLISHHGQQDSEHSGDSKNEATAITEDRFVVSVVAGKVSARVVSVSSFQSGTKDRTPHLSVSRTRTIDRKGVDLDVPDRLLSVINRGSNNIIPPETFDSFDVPHRGVRPEQPTGNDRSDGTVPKRR